MATVSLFLSARWWVDSFFYCLRRCLLCISSTDRRLIWLVLGSVLLCRITLAFWAPPPTPQPGWWIGRLEGITYASGNALFLPIEQVEGTQIDGVGKQCKGREVGSRVQLSGLDRALDGQAYVPGACVLLQLQPLRNEQAQSVGLWAKRQRIVARYRIASPLRYLDGHADRTNMVRLDLRRRFEALVSDGQFRVSAPIALGLVTGDRALMKPWMWEVFSRTGTGHLMSISGSHVTSIGLLFYIGALWLLKRVPIVSARIPAQYLALLVSLMGATGYGLLAGMNVPTQRTLAMMVAACVARLRGGSLLSWEVLGMAAFALCLVDPLAVIDVGAWLSFSAVALIMLVTSGYLRPPSKIRIWWMVQCGLFVGLAPVSAAVFGGYSVVGPAANAVAIPLVGLVITPLSLLAGLLMTFSPGAGHGVFFLLDPLVGVMFSLLQWLSDWDWAMIRLPPLDPAVAMVCVLGAVMVLMPLAMPFRLLSLALILPSMIGPGLSAEKGWIDVSIGSRWDVLVDSGSRVIRIQQAAGHRSDMSLKAWAEQSGHVLAREEPVNGWVSNGFLITLYDKIAGLPGQLMLVPRHVSFPCLDVLEPGSFSAVRASESTCWLVVDWGGERWLFADELDRKTQLQLASTPWRADRLAVSPRSSDRLLGATVTREGLEGVVFGPGTSTRYQPQEDLLKARGLEVAGWVSSSFFHCGTHKRGWLRCRVAHAEKDEKIAANWPVM